jgi:nucleolar protein 56
LGAEKALFRALKTKGNTPKYGLIYHSTFIGRAEAKNKGRISRYLANKCSIATRIDSFSDNPTRVYGEKLREQVEERLKFYETGQAPRRNIDVMEEIAKSMKGSDDVDMKDATPKSSNKKSKKDKKRKTDEDEDEADDMEVEPSPSKKAKANDSDASDDESPKKKSKKDKKKKKDKKRKSSD